MFKKKCKKSKCSTNKSNLDKVLWLIENYLPRKERGAQKKLYMDNIEADTFKNFSKLASTLSKTLLLTTKTTTISFTFNNWPLSYLKLLKKIGIAK